MRRAGLLAAIVVVGLVAGVAAQQRPRIPPTGAIRNVRDNLYVIPGAGNTVVFVTRTGGSYFDA